MSKEYAPDKFASIVFAISIAGIVAWILASFFFVIERHP
jgi:hypothetical protein